MTVWKRSMTGLIATDASMQIKWRKQSPWPGTFLNLRVWIIGFFGGWFSFVFVSPAPIVPCASTSCGSIITEKPRAYVETRVANVVNLMTDEISETSANSKVRDKEAKRSAQKRNGFRSMYTRCLMSRRKAAGDSSKTVLERIRCLKEKNRRGANFYFKYSMRRLKKFRNESAVRIVPGMASSRIASGRTGFAHAFSTARSSCTFRRLFTIRLYSSSRRSLFSDFNFLTCSLNSVRFLSHLSNSLNGWS